MRVFAIILLWVLVMYGVLGMARAQGSVTNPPPAGMTNETASSPASDTNEILPEVAFNNVPLDAAILNLGRQTGINYQIDLRCKAAVAGDPARGIPEPEITFHLKNVTAREVLRRLLEVHGLVLVQDPVTTVWWISKKNLPPQTLNSDLLTAGVEPATPGRDQAIIPLIQFEEVPLDMALGNLATQGGIDLKVSPKVDDAGYEPVSVRWTNLTARQAIVAICQNYGLDFTTNDVPGVVEVVPMLKTK